MELLAQDTKRMVRLELAGAQLQANQANAALATIAPVHTVTPADSQRFFRIAVYAHLGSGDREGAAATAKHFMDVAKTAEDKQAAEKLMALTAPRAAPVAPRPQEASEGGGPRKQRGSRYRNRRRNWPRRPLKALRYQGCSSNFSAAENRRAWSWRPRLAERCF
jgi:hypothetical protein